VNDLRFFLALAHPDRWWLRLGAALSALTLLMGIGLLSLSGWFITAAAVAGLAGAGRGFNYLFASGGVRGFALFRTVGRYAERMVTHEATFRILARLRIWVFDTAAPLAPSKLNKLRGGDLLARVTQDVDALDNLYLRLITPLVAALMGAVTAGILLALFAPMALPGVLGVFALAGVGLPLWAARRGKSAGLELTEASALTRAEAGDLAAGLAELKAYGADQRIIDRLNTASSNWIEAQRTIATQSWINAALLSLAAPFSFVLGFALAAASGASAPLSSFAGFIAFGLFEAAAPLVMAGELYGKTTASARRLKALSEIQPDVIAPDTDAQSPANTTLCVTDLSFSYPETDKRVLDNVSLTLNPGDRLALVGASGSGKSSLIKLFMRYYSAQTGMITLGGAPLDSLTVKTSRGQMALVDQRAELLSTTIRANLRLANPEASDDALWDALELARAADFVRALPDQLASWTGEQGALISGGQARRIALARAFVKNAPVLLLDEPTEGLDEATEADFLHSLEAWLAADSNRSCLIVTHRPALLESANAIAVLESGKIQAQGTIDALNGRNPHFDSLFPTLRSQ